MIILRRGLKVFAYPILLVTMCTMIGLLWDESWNKYEVESIMVLLMGIYLLSIYLNYTYHYIKDRKWINGQFFRVKQYQVIKQLAKSMAHAIRNPLTVTRGFLQLIHQKKLVTEQGHTYCEHAESGIKEADDVITTYLHYAKIEINTPYRLHVQAEIDKNIIPFIAPLCIQSQVEIVSCHLTKECMYIHGYSDVFCQLILNLMTNAVEAMPAGGKLELTTWVDNKSVYIHIEDTGTGIDRQKMNRIGTPFYDDMNEKGTGLGLMMALSIVEAMNGTISYYSRPNEGTACLLQYKQA